MSPSTGKPESAFYDAAQQTLAVTALTAQRERLVGDLLDRVRAAGSGFYADRSGGERELEGFPATDGADWADEVAAHPPFGRLRINPEQPIRTGLARCAVPRPVPIYWTRADLDAEAAWGARALWRAGARGRSRTSDCLEGGLVTPGTLAISDALDHLDALALPVGPITTDAALERAREVWSIVRPEFLIVDAPSFAFLDEGSRRPDCTLVVILTPADADLLRQPARSDVYRILSVPQVCTFAAGECSAHAGYHVTEDAVAAEVVDRGRHQAVKDGNSGTLLLTPLRRSTALLRFDTGLRATIASGQCGCGETHRRIIIA